MNLIVAADANWGIGRENKLLVSIPADMKFFRTTTTGKVVIMGRKTLESIEEALEEAKKYPQEDVYVIGGDSIYKQMLPYCTKAHVTKIDFAYEADTFFPNLDEDEQWEVTERSEEQTYFDLEYEFRTYERKK